MGKKLREEILEVLGTNHGVTGYQINELIRQKSVRDEAYGLFSSLVALFSRPLANKMIFMSLGNIYPDLWKLEEEKKIRHRVGAGPRPRRYYYYLV
ncbi:MAG TPA: hypothetical protein VGE31_02915 [Candidatus Paceibacterota bacterium]